MNALLEIKNLAVYVADASRTCLVEPVSLAVPAGESFTLLGESGSGKSLLAQSIMGTLPEGLRAEGEVSIGGEISPANDARKRRALWGRKIALLPQEPWVALDPTMRAHEQVEEIYRFVRGFSRKAAIHHTVDALSGFDLSADRHKFPFQLSGGMAQRVAFAAVTATNAPVLIVDEPTKGLDAPLRDYIAQLLFNVLNRGGTVLLITHDVTLARMLGGTVAVMRQSETVELGAASHVLMKPNHAYSRALLDAEPINWPEAPPLDCSQVTKPSEIDRSIVETHAIAKSFGTRTLFENISVEIRAGERVAITGPSGAGKTTLGNILIGLTKPTTGKVGYPKPLKPMALQKLYQDPLAAFPPRLSLRLAVQDVLRLHQIPSCDFQKWLERLSLNEALLDRLPHQVSGGELQRIALARLMVLKPSLVFADEPTSRLDLVSQRQTISLLVSALEEVGGALVLVTHDASLSKKVCHREIALGDHA